MNDVIIIIMYAILFIKLCWFGCAIDDCIHHEINKT